MISPTLVVIISVIVGFIGAIYIAVRRVHQQLPYKDQSEDEKADDADDGDKPATEVTDGRRDKCGELRHAKKPQSLAPTSSSRDSFTHPWLVTNLKGHTSPVYDVDWSDNGKYLLSCDRDRQVLMWHCKDFTEKIHKVSRHHIPYDSASRIRWSPDNRAFIIQNEQGNRLQAFKLVRNGKDSKSSVAISSIESAVTFPAAHDTDIIGMGVACTGKFAMTCSDKTTLIVWDLRGARLATVDTCLMTTYCAKVTPCGRFVVCSGFAPDVKFYEVQFSADKSFQSVNRVFDLVGHDSGVISFDFNDDTSRTVTLCKDGKLRLFDTQIDFRRGQEPSLIMTAEFDVQPQLHRNAVALSPDGLVACVTNGSQLIFYACQTSPTSSASGRDKRRSSGAAVPLMRRVTSIDNVFYAGDSGKVTGEVLPSAGVQIRRVAFCRPSAELAGGLWIAVCGGKHVRIFKNVIGLVMQADALRAKIADCATADHMRERLRVQLNQMTADHKLVELNAETH